MMKTTKRFYKKYFGLCSEWYFTDRSIKRENYFEFGLFPYLQNGIKDNLEEAVFRDMITRGKEEVEKIAGQELPTSWCYRIYLSSRSMDFRIWKTICTI